MRLPGGIFLQKAWVSIGDTDPHGEGMGEKVTPSKNY